jgi:hypothetical protein
VQCRRPHSPLDGLITSRSTVRGIPPTERLADWNHCANGQEYNWRFVKQTHIAHIQLEISEGAVKEILTPWRALVRVVLSRSDQPIRK